MPDRAFVAARVKTCEAMITLLRKIPAAATVEHTVAADGLYHRALAAGYRAQVLFYKDALTKLPKEENSKPGADRDHETRRKEA